MRIAFCHHYSLSHGGGGERILVDAANFLASKGHDVSIYSLPFRRRNAQFNLAEDIRYFEKPLHKFEADVSYHVYAPLVPYLFRSEAPRIAGLHGAVVADYETSPTDFFRQGVFVAGAYVFRQLLGRRALGGFDAIHTVNPAGVKLNHPRIFKIPNWVDCARSSDLLRSKRIRQKKFRVLFVGKPYYIKGIDRFFALSKMFHQDDIEFVATFTPRTGEYGTGGSGRVQFAGRIPSDKIWDLYSSGGVLVHPTRKETFGLVILESLASGTPVLTTPIPCHSVLKLPVQYASSIPSFAAKIKDIYDLWRSDYDDYLKMGDEGAEAVKHYDRRILLPRFEGMLKQVANSGNSVPA
jgi:glycosyltransferase involved in cell wall biosynthesis